MNYTIVGGGTAAYSALKRLQRYDPEPRVTIVSEEEHCFYYRHMTPLVFKGDRERDEILFDDHLPDFKIIHDRATALDVENRKLTLEKHDLLDFDRLLIATGSTPIIPDIPGIKEDNVFSLRTSTDAEFLKKAARKGGEAVILGGGLAGIKKAEALNRMGLSVTVVEQKEHILRPRIDREGAEIITNNLESKGITIVTSNTIAAILADSQGVTLGSGNKLEADLICIAAGVRPNIAWLEGSSLETDMALVVDERMETNAAGIYGAGDAVQTRDIVTGEKIVSALWPNAVEMGEIAGTNMAGGNLKYDGSLEILNSTEIGDTPFITAGSITPEGEGYETMTRRHNDKYKKLVFKNDRLVGTVFLGDITGAGIYTSLIRTEMNLGSLKEKLLAGEPITYTDFFMKNSLPVSCFQ